MKTGEWVTVDGRSSSGPLFLSSSCGPPPPASCGQRSCPPRLLQTPVLLLRFPVRPDRRLPCPDPAVPLGLLQLLAASPLATLSAPSGQVRFFSSLELIREFWNNRELGTRLREVGVWTCGTSGDVGVCEFTELDLGFAASDKAYTRLFHCLLMLGSFVKHAAMTLEDGG